MKSQISKCMNKPPLLSSQISPFCIPEDKSLVITVKGLRKCLKEGVISMTCKALHGDSKALKK